MTPDEARLKNILEAGLGFSSMTRVFEKETTQKILNELPAVAEKLKSVRSQADFDKIHEGFCKWGASGIKLNRKHENEAASYGQIAKTLNVILKAAVYYSHLPDCATSAGISGFLHAAVDNRMMAGLKDKLGDIYPKDFFRGWPASLAQVDKKKYEMVREAVNAFIKKERRAPTPVKYDDICWREDNGKDQEAAMQ